MLQQINGLIFSKFNSVVYRALTVYQHQTEQRFKTAYHTCEKVNLGYMGFSTKFRIGSTRIKLVSGLIDYDPGLMGFYRLRHDLDYYCRAVACTANYSENRSVLACLTEKTRQVIFLCQSVNQQCKVYPFKSSEFFEEYLLLSPRYLPTIAMADNVAMDIVYQYQDIKEQDESVHNIRITQFAHLLSAKKSIPFFYGVVEAIRNPKSHKTIDNWIIDVNYDSYSLLKKIILEKGGEEIYREDDIENIEDILASIKKDDSVNFYKQLRKNLNLNQINGNLVTPLHYAIIHNKQEFVKELINAGADVNVTNLTNQSALLIAARIGNTEIIKYIISCGGKLTDCSVRGENALMFAADRGHSDAVKLLLELGIDPHICNKNDQTALDFATMNGHQEVRKILLSA